MKKSILILSIFSLLSFSNSTSIEKNQKRITQIDSQVKANTNKINTNNTKISTAIDEALAKKEVANLNVLISKLQKEFDDIEAQYVVLLQSIGKSTKEINESIRKIEDSNQKITEGKTSYKNKIKVWNKVINSNVLTKSLNTAQNTKKQHDLNKILGQEQTKIKNIESYKSQVEVHKKNEEKAKNEKEIKAKAVEKTKKELEAKRTELRVAKDKKDAAVKNLQYIQSSLKNENKKIEKTNNNLIAEKKRLNQQISAIIAAAKKREEEARRRAAEQAAKANAAKNNTNTSSKTSTTTTPKEVEVVRGTGQFIMPISGSIVVHYGQEKSPGLVSKGIEIRGSLGQSVKASDTGSVLYSGSLKGLGAVIMIDHGTFITVYGNLASVKVASGTKVTKGQVIGTLGRESITKEPNLYFEVRKGVNYVNPASYL